MKIIKLKNKKIGDNQPVFIIAEAGVNHNGSFVLAKKLIDAAVNAGADAVKFQNFRAENVVTENVELAKYQKINTTGNRNMREMIKRLELSEVEFKKLSDYCQKKKIIFLSSPHGGFKSIDQLVKLGVCAFKFGSGDLTNLPALDYAASFKKPMIISTGMSTIKEIKDAVNCIKARKNSKIILLHCTTEYPCPIDQANLYAIKSLQKFFKTLVGYSDHTERYETSMLSIALGASILEKHLTLNKNLPGPDHKASLNPEEFKEFVRIIRKTADMLGTGFKKPTVSELQYIPLVRKSLVAERNITKGEILTTENISIKRPGTGILPKYFKNFLGRKAKRNIKQDSILKFSDI